MTISRVLIAVVAAIVLGELFGEALWGNHPVSAAVLVVGLPVLVWRAVSGMSLKSMVVVEVAIILTFASGAVGGLLVGERAWSTCFDTGEALREALNAHYLEYGAYPSELSDLDVEIPGDRILLPSILRYEVVGAQYYLSCEDPLFREARATFSQPFAVSK